MIRSELLEDGSTVFYTRYGTKVPRSFTPETDKEQIEQFRKLLNEHEERIVDLTFEYYERIEWNEKTQKRGGKGQNWPVFSQMDKLLNQLQKQSGIVDT